MSDPTSDLTFRPHVAPQPRRDNDAWEAVIREELRKLRRLTPSGPRVVPASREPASHAPDTPPSAT
jgi:hypothetical protein